MIKKYDLNIDYDKENIIYCSEKESFSFDELEKIVYNDMLTYHKEELGIPCETEKQKEWIQETVQSILQDEMDTLTIGFFRESWLRELEWIVLGDFNILPEETIDTIENDYGIKINFENDDLHLFDWNEDYTKIELSQDLTLRQLRYFKACLIEEPEYFEEYFDELGSMLDFSALEEVEVHKEMNMER